MKLSGRRAAAAKQRRRMNEKNGAQSTVDEVVAKTQDDIPTVVEPHVEEELTALKEQIRNLENDLGRVKERLKRLEERKIGDATVSTESGQTSEKEHGRDAHMIKKNSASTERKRQRAATNNVAEAVRRIKRTASPKVTLRRRILNREAKKPRSFTKHSIM
ncbi:hypothetical protein AB6A40_008862 [Gnathostoma spinigerum]|uniref:Uncharacterized protein n=1 Tax=Gnathostoma spinigerum TaxID=75299 RepID=A0ABD6EYJ9_9BILA